MRHIDVVRRQDITNIFLCKVIYFLIKKILILRENYQKKLSFVQTNIKSAKYTDIIQAEEKQKKKRTKTKTTSLDTPP